MALPTLEKTWQFNVNQIVGGVYPNNHSDAIYRLKQSLITFASNPWTVWGSAYRHITNPGDYNYSNGPGGVDYWTSYQRCHWTNGTGNHSWIVLQQSGLGTNVAICIDCNYGVTGDINYINLIIFPTGVGTPGTNSSRPTATDEVVWTGNYGQWGGGYQLLGYGRLHAMQSTDGECTRIIFTQNNYANGFWLFDKPKDPISLWTPPVVGVLIGGGSTDEPSYGHLNHNSYYCKSRLGSQTQGFYMLAEGCIGDSIGEMMAFPDDDSAEWPFIQIQLATIDMPHRGTFKGSIRDLWWGPSVGTIGTCYPDDTSKQFVQFGSLIFPWDGSTPRTI